MKAYADFDLSIERGGEGYFARVLRSPAGELPSIQFPPPFSKNELQKLVPHSMGDGRDVKARRSRSDEAAFREAGAKLFRAVFSGEILARWSASMASCRGKVLRLRLRLNDPEAAGWPWEYLFDSPLDRWLALSPDVSIVRYPDLPEALEPLAVTPPLRILVLVAARTGHRPLAADREWKHIEDGLSGLRESGQVVLERLESVNLQALREKLRHETWHVLHFIGHGGLDVRGEGTLLFQAENGGRVEVSGRDLGAVLLGHPALRLVVLNSCDGAREGRSDAFSSVAQSLVRSRIPAVVAMRVPVSDGAATSFARHFYRELVEGDSLDEVLTQTRQGMLSDGYKVEWGTPVLLLRAESGQIFEIASWWRVVLRWAMPVFALCFTIAIGAISLKNQAPSQESGARVPAQVETHPRCPMPHGLDIAFQLIESGRFTMGSGSGGDKDERPAHEVTISKSFCIGFNEVTQRQWNTVMLLSGGSTDHLGEDLPVTVARNRALEFVEALNVREPGAGFRLPTEAEWEYANSPGSTVAYNFMTAPKQPWDLGNCNWREGDDGFAGPSPVRLFQPNLRGLYDMIGNVHEWVSDWYEPYTAEPVTDPTGPPTGDKAIRRGGSWDSRDQSCRPTARSIVKPDTRFQTTGFRIVREPLPVLSK